MTLNKIKHKIHKITDAHGHYSGSKINLFNLFSATSIIIFIIISSLQTDPKLNNKFEQFFTICDSVIWVIFIIEWFIRFITASESPHYKYKKHPHLSWLFNPINSIDTLAILIGFILIILKNDDFVFLLRFLRLVIIIRYLRFWRHNPLVKLLKDLLKRHGSSLFVAICLVVAVTYMLSCLVWLTEKDINPQLNSIPKTFWWAIITVTTVGYGDIVPITVVGKAITIIFMLITPAFIALPGAIMAAGFIDILQEKKQQLERQNEIKQFAFLCNQIPSGYSFLSYKHKKYSVIKITKNYRRIIHIQANELAGKSQPINFNIYRTKKQFILKADNISEDIICDFLNESKIFKPVSHPKFIKENQTKS